MPILRRSRTSEVADPVTPPRLPTAPGRVDRTGREASVPRPAGPMATDPAAPVSPDQERLSPDKERPAPVPRAAPRSGTGTGGTRTSAAWAGLWVAAVVLIIFIVFLLSNTGSVQISFAAFHGNLPLAIALLIAMVTGVVVTLIVGTARITQIRRLARRRRQPPAADRPE